MPYNKEKLKLARAYIRPQTYERNYNPARGLLQGTIFPELDIPYRRRQ